MNKQVQQIYAEVERLIDINKTRNGFPAFCAVRIEAYEELLSFIDSLPDEPNCQDCTNSKGCVTCKDGDQFESNITLETRLVELDFRGEKVQIVRKYFKNQDTGRKFSNAELDDDALWATLRAWCEKKGISMFDLYPKPQSSDDLEKEIRKEAMKLHTAPCYDELAGFARYFYELGKNSK